MGKAIQKQEQLKPVLRWAGGKNWLVKHLNDLLPKQGFKNYHEPFLGGASIFLAIRPENHAFLSDLNVELIKTYTALKTHPEAIIDTLKTYTNTKEFYYGIRDKTFIDPIEVASRFIYLNQASFNGIYRVGKYNVVVV